MKKYFMLLFAALLVVAFTAPAFAWEFSMKGEYEYRFRYLGRTGQNDLFGVAGLQNQAIGGLPAGPVGTAGYNFVGFAGPNIYGTGAAVTVPDDVTLTSGVFITRGGYSRYNSDALYDDQRLTIYPEIRVNNAMRVHGVYTVGGMRNKFFQRSGEVLPNTGGTLTAVPGIGSGTPPIERYYMMNESSAAYNTAAIGSWEQVRATIQLPVAILSIGIKDFPFGTGASLANHTRANAFLTVVPYGPFRFLHGVWLATGNASGLFGHNTAPDSYTKHSMFQGALVTYDAADLTIGGGAIWRNYHRDAAVPARIVGVDQPVAAPGLNSAWVTGNGLDEVSTEYLAYFKYFNGRFFANAEYYWRNIDTHRLYNTNLGGGAVGQAAAAPTFQELYLFFSEAGLVCGPAKLSFSYALASGNVLNNSGYNAAGVPGNIAGVRVKQFAAGAMNYQVLEPYNFLMFQIYGGGNQTFNFDGTGQMSDAYAYSGRLDYAVASNLNVFGTYIWAHRLERAGFLKGGITNTGAPLPLNAAGLASHQAFVLANFGGASGVTGGSINPFVDDGFIGWEAGAGVDWKLLEGLTMNLRYAYWQPGDWFTQAYQSIAFSPIFGTANLPISNAALSGRDAIQAFHGSLLINF